MNFYQIFVFIVCFKILLYIVKFQSITYSLKDLLKICQNINNVSKIIFESQNLFSIFRFQIFFNSFKLTINKIIFKLSNVFITYQKFYIIS